MERIKNAQNVLNAFPFSKRSFSFAATLLNPGSFLPSDLFFSSFLLLCLPFLYFIVDSLIWTHSTPSESVVIATRWPQTHSLAEVDFEPVLHLQVCAPHPALLISFKVPSYSFSFNMIKAPS